MIVAVLGIASSDFPYMSSKLFFNYNSTPDSQLGMFDLQFTWYLYILSCLAVLVDTIYSSKMCFTQLYVSFVSDYQHDFERAKKLQTVT